MGKYYSSTIQKGSKGNDVTEWQKFLNTQGYNLAVDGDFGENTYSATVQWQMKNGLMNDGIVGKNSWGKAGYTLLDTSSATPAPNIGSAPTVPTFNNTPTARPTTNTTSWDSTEKGQAALGNYNTAKDAVNNYGDFTYEDYAKGDGVISAENALNSHNANKPGAYQSQWQSQLDELMNSILNRDKFSYDLNGDALYQQYKDKYIQQGKLAMGDAIGQASAMTGGYGNSYAQSVGQQAYQGQLDNLNDIVPQLYQMALDKYKMEGQELYNQYGMVADRENMDYGRYRDTVSDWLTERDYLTGRADTEYDRDYSKYIDDRNLDYSLHQDGYKKLLDALGIAQSDYYDGGNAYRTEQSITNEEAWKAYQAAEEARQYSNSLLQQGYENEFGEWEANTKNAWEQAKWDEAARQYAIDEQWRQKEFDAQYGGSSSEKTGGTGGSDKPANLPNVAKNPSAGYDNGGLTDSQIKEMQNALGITADGKWGSGSSKAAGGLTAAQAWDKYKKGLLGNKKPSVEPTESAATTSFMSYVQTKSEYLARGHSEKEFNTYIEDKITSFLRDGRLTDSEALYLIQHYGLS